MSETCSVRTAALLEAVALCGMAHKKRSSSALAQATHIAPGPLGLELRATDLAMSVGMAVATEGGVTGGVDGDRFSAAIRSVDGDIVTLSREGTKLTIVGESRRFVLPVTDYELPPKADKAPDVAPIALDGTAFSDGVRGVAFCCDSTSTTRGLGGVRMEGVTGALMLACASSARLASRRVQAVAKLSPATTVPLLYASAMAAAAEGGDASLWIGEGIALLRAGGKWVSAPVIEATPFPVADVIPKFCEIVATFDRDELLEAARSAAVVMNDEDGNKGLTIAVRNGRFTLAGGKGLGDFWARGSCDCKADFVGVYNYRFFIDAIRFGTGEKAVIGFNARNRPLGFDIGTEHEQVLMPINLEPAAAALAA